MINETCYRFVQDLKDCTPIIEKLSCAGIINDYAKERIDMYVYFYHLIQQGERREIAYNRTAIRYFKSARTIKDIILSIDNSFKRCTDL